MPRTNSVLLDGERWRRLAFARVATLADLQCVLGTPHAIPLRLFGAIEFWSTGNRAAEPNPIADRVLRALIEDAAEGLVIVSDREWERAKALAADPHTVPSVTGPCVVAGISGAGDPVPLPDRFSRWWRLNRDRVTSRQTGPPAHERRPRTNGRGR
jgi:hypothetical protein